MTAPPGFLAPKAAKPKADPGPGFGPDFTQTDGEPVRPPKINEKHPPKPSPLGNLGQNKKLRSPVRKLTEDDKGRVAALYTILAGIVRIFKPVAAQAIEFQTESCVDAWWDLAENNDKVRRALLALIEGGDWGKLFLAHLPIVVAVLPDGIVMSVMRGSLAQLFEQDSPPEESAQYPADQNGRMGD